MKLFLILGSLTLLTFQPHVAGAAIQPDPSIALRWNSAALQGIRIDRGSEC
jgi:hypothetical protein